MGEVRLRGWGGLTAVLPLPDRSWHGNREESRRDRGPSATAMPAEDGGRGMEGDP